MSNEQSSQNQGSQQGTPAQQQEQPQAQSHQQQVEQNKQAAAEAFDALANKKPEELTPEELRLMADTMPGEGPGD